MGISNTIESPSDYEAVVQALEESVRRNLTDGLLLSGGLDTTILAYLATKWVKPSCITVALRDAPAPDIEYAKLVVGRLHLKHYIHYFDFGGEELEDSIRATIRIMKSFDPMEIRNSATIHVALKVAKAMGMSSVMTGDGGDELFGGYSFLFGLTREQLDVELRKLWDAMIFSSIYLTGDLGLEVKLPFLDPEFKAFAMNLDAGMKVRSERGQIWGKWILRKAFENIIPGEIVWRVKDPIEVGSGATIIPSLFDSIISGIEFGKKKRKYLEGDGVTIRSKEHLFYYEIYRSLIGVPYATDNSAKRCPDCGTNVEERASYCRTCGAHPV